MAIQPSPDNAAHPAEIDRPDALKLMVEMRRSGKPIAMTVNQIDFAIEDEGSYQQLIALVERLETIGGIREAIQDVDAGRTLALDEFKTEARQRHRLSTKARR